MATIGKIRQRSGALIFIIALAIMAFVLSDLISQNQSLIGGADYDMTVGEVAGDEIPAEQFEEMYQRFVNNYKAQQNVNELDAKQRMQINNQAWESLIQEQMLEAEYNDLGLKVTNAELNDLALGDEVHEYFKQIPAFKNEQGVFDRNRLREFIQNFDNVPTESQITWLNLEQDVKNEQLRKKYLALISKGIYMTKLEAKKDYFAKNQYASIKYVRLKTADLEDSAYTATEEEMRAYAKENDMVYEKDERSIQYVSFSIEPTAQDSARAKNQVQKLYKEFSETPNPYAFARLNSDGPIGEDRFLNREEVKQVVAQTQLMPADKIDSVYTAPIGAVIGPLYEFGTYKMVKVVAEEEDSLTSYRASHILIEPKDNDTTAAMEKAKSLISQAREGDFAELAKKESDGPSATKGGDLGWWRTGKMVPAFQKAVETMEKGDLKVVKSRFGAHLIKLTEKPSKRLVKIAAIHKDIIASEETVDAAYDKAASFYDKARSAQEFANAIQEMEPRVALAENLKPMDVSFPGADDARSLIQWAFKQNEVDAISDIYTLEDQYVIARVTEIRVKGDLDIESNELTIKDEVVKNKKIADLQAKMSDAYSEDLSAIASALDIKVENASNISFNSPVVPSLGDEPKVIGKVFSLAEGATSNVIAGASGVYVVQLEGYTEVEEPENYAEYKQKLMSSKATSSQFYVLNALKELANVKDRRYRFY